MNKLDILICKLLMEGKHTLKAILPHVNMNATNLNKHLKKMSRYDEGVDHKIIIKANLMSMRQNLYFHHSQKVNYVYTKYEPTHPKTIKNRNSMIRALNLRPSNVSDLKETMGKKNIYSVLYQLLAEGYIYQKGGLYHASIQVPCM